MSCAATRRKEVLLLGAPALTALYAPGRGAARRRDAHARRRRRGALPVQARPGTATRSLKSVAPAVMNRLLQVVLAPGEVGGAAGHADHAAGSVAAASNTWMPPGPQQYRLPSLSIFMPSGAPAPSPESSAQTRPLAERAVGLHVEHADVHALGVVDEQALLVGREAQAVRLREVVGQQASGSPPRARRGRRRGSRAAARASRRSTSRRP